MTKTFVDENIDGWSYRSVDFITFPMGFVHDDEFIYVSYGRNDRNGWIAKLNRTVLLKEHLVPVKTRVVSNQNQNQKHMSTQEAASE